MLRELHIRNLAVIEDARIELSAGLNCFTGQTGAGKSLVLGAFEIMLGLRTGGLGEMLRPGADEAKVSGVFEVHDEAIASQVETIAGLSFAVGEELLISRRVFASGRSSFSINGEPATAGMVRSLGELLVDVHGQHDHQFLLKPSNQLLILDRYADTFEERERFAALHVELRELRERRKTLTASRTLRQQQLELYEFQAEEIDKAEPIAGEFAELKAQHDRLSNLKRIGGEAGQAHAALYESEGSALERLQMIAHVLIELAEVDQTLAETAEQVRTATLSLQEASFDLGRYIDRLELDPSELAEIEERLNTLNRLISKYGDKAGSDEDALAPVLAYREQIGEAIGQLRGENDDLAGMDERIGRLSKDLGVVGESLSRERQQAAEKLCPLVEAQFKELGMSEARLHVAFERMDPDDATSPTGLDAIEFMVQTNPGQPARPLRKIASGGELSRIMLALKSILAESDRTSVLVFDEIDSNIGGRLGTVIGRKLRVLANGESARQASGGGSKSKGTASRKKSNVKKAGTESSEVAEGSRGSHQVLCITHLPQIAAFADCHLRISKDVAGKGKSRTTTTTVTAMQGDARIEELAEMLAGQEASGTTRKQAEELLAMAGR